MKRPVDPLAKVKLYDRENAEAALLIAADPQRYDGLPLLWARMVVEKQTPTVRGPLFQERAA